MFQLHHERIGLTNITIGQYFNSIHSINMIFKSLEESVRD